MPGITKRKYVGEIMRFNKQLKRPLKLILEVLPYAYDENVIINLFKELYPYEWKTINERYKEYKEKDKFLIKVGKKERYRPLSPKKYLLSLPQIKYKLSYKAKQSHKNHFNEQQQLKELEELKNKRLKVIKNKEQKIHNSMELMQNVEPLYIDLFITAYHKKGITIEGKMEIFKELQKYECEKSLKFFYKLNDSERNSQIRNMAFKHLQNSGHYCKLRKSFKGKKKEYMLEKTEFNMTPADLVKRIENNTVQNRKSYDVFISHSSKDSSIVKKVIKALNKQGLTCYCDWTSDNDFLKRNMVSDFTKEVLKKRLQQSKKLLLVKSDRAINSWWVNFEIQYFEKLSKPLYYINLDNQGVFNEEGFKKVKYDLKKYEIEKI
ncbi:toll/interleukin-1 receptor domain-containing protein [Clostridium butyricum]|uniref:TIR domain-containing protein n=1 Tax=Clostridium butyricum E4 str. BoNT E BL5262 TaxID=632245 RepID=C4IHB1_CLOBU|nr:toll/interleukin-1 receptor domain-containing protein [Clostridium butyricum]EDT75429.1 conserved hypothetical protein [Clostridium butyricum 5521]EEP53473.1 conserved hypothetical protein [Clostridium butyricum E4 str. BoNT E BL5262]NFL30253.1 toll/interleukin-1 receptor domain-containing protein [Clostridium butyricum]NFS17645.1 toll/interleukin-1 receptor domain-containing protein [Clostridium butyricum]